MGKVIHLQDLVPTPKQQEVHGDACRFILLRGGWRSGKTVCAIHRYMHQGIRVANAKGKGATFAVFRTTGPSLRDYTIKDFQEIIPPQFILNQRTQEGREEFTLPGGTRVIFRSMDKWQKYGGASFDAIFMDEAKEFSYTEFEMLRSRLSGRFGPREMILCTNPPTRSHWLYKLFGDPLTRQPGYAEHHFTTWDNAQNLPDDYLDDLRTLEKTDPAKYRRYVLGEWGFTTDNQPVYAEFDVDRNGAFLEPQKGVGGPFLLNGWDFGFRRPAVVWAQVLATGHVNFLREETGLNIELRPFIKRYKTLHGLHYGEWPAVHYCDVAGRQRKDTGPPSVRVMVSEGIRPRYKKYRVMDRVNLFRDLIATTHLGRPYLQVDRRHCPMLLEGFLGGYAIDPDTDEPVKDGEYDNAQDAAAYAVCPILLRPKQSDGDRRKPGGRQRVAV